MALILNIDTALENGSVMLASDGKVLTRAYNNEQKDHAAWLHIAIREILQQAGFELSNIDAVAVTSGPGSYTGIRVGMASVKGLCYALNIPLITINTLLAMAWSQREVQNGEGPLMNVNFCPMIDARRDEVFTAVYDAEMQLVMEPTPLTLDETSYETLPKDVTTIFFGNGSDKWKPLNTRKNVMFQKWEYVYFNLAYLSEKYFQDKAFADLAYVQPDYLKEFYTHKKK